MGGLQRSIAEGVSNAFSVESDRVGVVESSRRVKPHKRVSQGGKRLDEDMVIDRLF